MRKRYSNHAACRNSAYQLIELNYLWHWELNCSTRNLDFIRSWWMIRLILCTWQKYLIFPDKQQSSLSRLDQHHGCWWPGSLRRQVISSHDIDYVKYAVFFFLMVTGFQLPLSHQCRGIISNANSYRCLSGKLWYLLHNCVGDTIVYH